MLNGAKRWIGNGTFADVVVIWARDEVDDEVKGFLVEKGTPGFETSKMTHKIALRAIQNADIVLTDVQIPEATRLQNANLVGIREPLAAHEQPIMRTYLAVEDIQQAVQTARGSGVTVAYSLTRRQPGHLPIVIQRRGTWTLAALARSSECLGESAGMGSPQTLSEADRRIVAGWAAECAHRVLWLYEAEAPGDSCPRDAIARTRAFARGELDVAEEIRRRFVGGSAAREVATPSAAAAAKAAGQAAAITHMGAHALGAAAYAAKAAGLAALDRPEAVTDEIQWQLSHMSAATRTALRQLPPVVRTSWTAGTRTAPSGLLGTITRDLQSGLASTEH